MPTSLSPLIDEPQRKKLTQLLDHASDIVITCHVSPDGDALGSTLALARVLCNSGKKAVVVTPDNPPRQLSFIPGVKDIIVASRFPDEAARAFRRADLIFCLDFNAVKRLDKAAPFLLNANAPRVLVDHHLYPEIAADIVISHPEVSSTSALVYRLIADLGMLSLIDLDAASCIYTGMMTDTGNFTYNSLDPDLYIIVADLVARGVDKDAIYNRVFNSNSASRLRICSYAIYSRMQLFPELHTALITLSADELADFGYVKGDTESLVNVPLSIPGIHCSIFMRQDRPDYVKISTRSRGDFPVNRLCELYFHGGGHLNAAGGEYNGSLSDAVSFLLDLLDKKADPWSAIGDPATNSTPEQ